MPQILAGLMLVFSLGITHALWAQAKQDAAQKLQVIFDISTHETIGRIMQRMSAYEQILRGLRGLFDGSIEVTRDEFHSYVSALRLDEHYPGVQGVGYAMIVPKAQKASHVDAIRKKGFPEYKINPEDERDFYTSIVEIEPFSGMNLRAFGYDMYTNPVRRAAMMRARDQGKAALSGKVTLVQEGEQGVQPGFLMYLPVYRSGMPTDTVENRRAAIVGWVYAPFRVNDLMQGMRDALSGDLDIRIYDDGTMSAQSQLYGGSAAGAGRRVADLSLQQATQRIEIGGRAWTVAINPLPAFEARVDTDRPKVIATAGILASLLLSLLIWLLATGRARALTLATEMTGELKESEKWLNLALQSAQLGIVDWDIKQDTVIRSARHDQIYGYDAPVPEWSLQTFLHHLPPEDREHAQERIRECWDTGRMDMVFRIIQPGGALRWVSVKGSVLYDKRGQPARQIGMVADITELKQAEDILRKAHDELEIRVRQRTADLQKTNERLNAEICERNRVEADLRASRERLASIFDAMTEGLVVQTRDGSFMECNAAAERILGLSAEQLATTDALDRFMPTVHEDGSPFPGNLHPAAVSLRTGLPARDVVMGLKKPDGNLTWVSINTELLFDSEGKVSMVVSNLSDITGKKHSEEMIWNQANFDALTGLPNRRLFYDHLRQGIRTAHRTGMPLALMFLDLDRFKDVNDTLGHDTGDILLKEAAQRLQSCVRESDTVARLGGDEFTIIMGELRNPGHIAFVAQKILQKMAEPFHLGIETAHISASIGITLYPEDASDADVLLRNADQAMYAAKNLGRNRYSHFTTSMEEATQTRMWLANELRGALNGQQLKMVYQPIVELATGDIAKAEALMRWEHPERGPISPSVFIPIAEETGMIIEIGDWAFREVANQVKRWRMARHPAFQISINKSPVQFRSQSSNAASWSGYLQKLGLPGQSIALEITEGMLLDASANIIDQLLEYRDAGIQVSLDDFGTGYSSLAYLKKFDIDNLKIDQSFVRNLAPGSDDIALCEAIIVMAHKLNLKVVAEGVETEQQRDLLAAVGCDYGQGYLFSRPVSPEEFAC